MAMNYFSVRRLWTIRAASMKKLLVLVLMLFASMPLWAESPPPVSVPPDFVLAMRFGIIFSIASVCGLLAIVAALLRAPEGYEDENSFHVRARRKQERLPRYV